MIICDVLWEASKKHGPGDGCLTGSGVTAEQIGTPGHGGDISTELTDRTRAAPDRGVSDAMRRRKRPEGGDMSPGAHGKGPGAGSFPVPFI